MYMHMHDTSRSYASIVRRPNPAVSKPAPAVGKPGETTVSGAVGKPSTESGEAVGKPPGAVGKPSDKAVGKPDGVNEIETENGAVGKPEEDNNPPENTEMADPPDSMEQELLDNSLPIDKSWAVEVDEEMADDDHHDFEEVRGKRRKVAPAPTPPASPSAAEPSRANRI
jgi:hypothetical protein